MRILRKAFTLVEVLITISVVVLLTTISMPGIIRERISVNEESARAALKEISTALETYAEKNLHYPANFSDLVNASPAYLNYNYIAGSPVKGYNFTCQSLDAGGYSCSATPQRCGLTGLKIYTITTGGMLNEGVDCE